MARKQRADRGRRKLRAARAKFLTAHGFVLVLLLASLPSSFSLQAQESQTPDKLRLLQANEMIGVKQGTQQLRRLIDNVRFRHGKTTITCSLAIDYPKEERWVLIGDVVIFDDEKTLKADTVHYTARTKEYRAVQNVELTTDSTTIRCSELSYFIAQKKAVARRNVRIIDKKENIELTSDHAEHYRDRQYTKLTKNPVFVQFDSTGQEETRIVGKTMEAIDGGQQIIVDQEVIITHADIRATCGHAEYYRGSERIHLTIEPVAYQKNNRLTGKEIELHLQNRKIHQVHVLEQALAEFVPDSSANAARPNTISGKKLVAYIEGDFVEKIDVNGTATCVYYVEENGVDKGVNRAQGDSLTLFLSNNAIRRIIFDSSPGKSTGKFLPPGHAVSNDVTENRSGQKQDTTADKNKDT